MTYDVNALREREFPWAARGDAIYLNNASTGPTPQRCVRAVSEFMRLRAEPFRLSDELQFETLRRSRELCARLIGASPSEVALMVNTSYGINFAARALPLREGDVVLSFDAEFPANVYPWMALERSAGVTLRQISSVSRLPDEDALLRSLDDPGVKAVSVSWVSFATGYKVDLRHLGAACRERGIYLVVDAIQGLGAAALDVKESHVDILACGAQKWLLSPWGTGFVYVRDALIQRLEPSAVGWMSVRDSDDFTRMLDYDFTYRDDARRFEVITLPFQDFAGMNASLELLLELGPAAIADHILALTQQVVDWARARGLRLVTPEDERCRAGIVSVTLPDVQTASRRLASARVTHSVREGAIRLSPHCYNSREEIARALEVLDRTRP
jgi:selenocysteine lyase/cysteine desulfurase